MNKRRLRDSKIKTQELQQKHEMCKTNAKTNIFYINICEHEHENIMTRPWCKIMLERNDRSHFYLYPFGDLVQKKLPKRLLCVH
jgi:hypothetical protein